MNQAKLENTGSSYFIRRVTNYNEACIFGDILGTEVLGDSDQYRESIRRNDKLLDGNVCSIEKKGDQIIISHDWIAPELEIKMSVTNFLELLDEWDKIWIQQPEELLLTWDGKQVHFQTIGEPL